IGAPLSLPIYFSVDFDAGSQLDVVDAYFDGVASVLGVDRVGAYGGYATIKNLFDTGRIRWGWQAYAWSYGQWDARPQVRQVQNGVDVAGGTCDLDVAVAANFGQWSTTPTADAAGYAAAANPTNGIRDLYVVHNDGELVHNWAWSTGPWQGWDSMGCCFT